MRPAASMRIALAALALTAAASSCDGDDDTTGDDDTSWTPPDGGVITLTTRDGVTLEADYYPAAAAGAPGVVLLHMNPMYNDRTNWPPEFIGLLRARDWAVLAVDRRGTGGSGGDPEEAFQGEKGRWDVEACAARLRDDGYGDLAIVGASNGTTSMLDYAVWAPEESLPEPVTMVYMTGGTYTEYNTEMERAPAVPALFTYSTEEATWSELQRDLDPGSWVFSEYPGAGHGTQMFEGAPEIAGDIDAFLAGIL